MVGEGEGSGRGRWGSRVSWSKGGFVTLYKVWESGSSCTQGGRWGCRLYKARVIGCTRRRLKAVDGSYRLYKQGVVGRSRRGCTRKGCRFCNYR